MEIILEWKLATKNFDELKSELSMEHQRMIGKNHCKLCVLASGMMCIKRSVCRAVPHNEIYINVEINEKP